MKGYRQDRLRKAECHRHRFPKHYTQADIALLAKTDELHDCLGGLSTRKIMEREWLVSGHEEFSNIPHISVSHVYNLRDSHLCLMSRAI